MKPIIIASKKDPAGMNIVENLKKSNCKIPIYLVDVDIVHAESIDKQILILLYLLASISLLRKSKA
ncbi:hypothetical protein HYW74_00800 [Candidatus Pacearchaeota archaeon]|nr:hypothetical protein [Candidatus Pacearchaeota archaeon]